MTQQRVITDLLQSAPQAWAIGESFVRIGVEARAHLCSEPRCRKTLQLCSIPKNSLQIYAF